MNPRLSNMPYRQGYVYQGRILVSRISQYVSTTTTILTLTTTTTIFSSNCNHRLGKFKIVFIPNLTYIYTTFTILDFIKNI